MSNHFISLSQAIEMTTRYRNEKENILAPEYKDTGILPICETFSRDAIDALLGQAGCESIRIYGGMSENLDIRYVVVGVNELGEDILPPVESQSSVSSAGDPAGSIVEDGIRCPTTCPPGSLLNGG